MEKELKEKPNPNPSFFLVCNFDDLKINFFFNNNTEVLFPFLTPTTSSWQSSLSTVTQREELHLFHLDSQEVGLPIFSSLFISHPLLVSHSHTLLISSSLSLFFTLFNVQFLTTSTTNYFSSLVLYFLFFSQQSQINPNNIYYT